MKLISTGRKYFDVDYKDKEIIDQVRHIFSDIYVTMNNNSFLAEDDYPLTHKKEDVMICINLLDLLTEYDNPYIENATIKKEN